MRPINLLGWFKVNLIDEASDSNFLSQVLPLPTGLHQCISVGKKGTRILPHTSFGANFILKGHCFAKIFHDHDLSCVGES